MMGTSPAHAALRRRRSASVYSFAPRAQSQHVAMLMMMRCDALHTQPHHQRIIVAAAHIKLVFNVASFGARI